MDKFDIIIIGAGAAGLAAAYQAKAGMKVLILEKMTVCGKKLAVTGGGRCNFANTASTENQIKCIRNGNFLKHAFKAFSPDDVKDWFTELGVNSAVEEENKIFSTNLSARQIADLMLLKALNSGCEIRYNAVAADLLVSENRIDGVVLSDGSPILANSVIIACGGNSYPLTGSSGDGYLLAKKAGHRIVEPLPALTPLETAGFATDKISGVVLEQAKLNLIVNNKKLAESTGILLFTHTGISGPAALSISGRAVQALANGDKPILEADFYPYWLAENGDFEFQQILNQHGKKNISNIIAQLVPASLADLILSTAQIPFDKKGAEINGDARKKILKSLKKCQLTVTGYKSWKEAMVTSGGVSVDEISAKTMESKLIKGLYFAGEVIDIDGDTGGFNLQAAFSTGVLAMRSAVKNLNQP